MIATRGSFYQADGGSLAHDAPSYVERAADRELFDALSQGEFCYVLTSRQMGKSSLMVRTTFRLREHGHQVVLLDLSAMGENLSPEQWYLGLLGVLGRPFDLEDKLDDFWFAHEHLGPLRRWMEALREVVLPALGMRQTSSDTDRPDASRLTFDASRLVIFIDEIDVVRSLPFSTDEFFAAIRECYNRRREDAAFEQVTFCLLGVATPSDLIRDTRTTPFNIGRRIELHDFTAGEAAPLRIGLALGGPETLGTSDAEARALLERVLYWTGGHPYLTQRLCRAVVEGQGSRVEGPVSHPSRPSTLDPRPSTALVDALCEELFLSAKAREQDANLLFVRDWLLRSEVDRASLLDLYGQIRRGKRVALDTTSPLVETLRLSGVVRVEQPSSFSRSPAGLLSRSAQLRVRNRIYERVFDGAWVAQHMPDAEVRRQRAAFRHGLLRAGAVSGVVLAVIGTLALSAVQSESRARQAALAAQQERDNAVRAGERERGQRVVAQTAEQKASRSAHEATASAKAAREAARRAAEEKRRAEENARLAGHQERLAQAAGEKERQAARHARDLLAREQLERGVRRLDQGDNLGLLDVLQAHQTAADIPAVRQAAASAWGGWAVAVEGRLARVVGHRDAVRALALSPDGTLMATGSGDHTARVWHTATGAPRGGPLRHQGDVVAVAFSPDGKLVATASLDHTARLWEAATGRPHGPPLRHADSVEKVAFSPDGRLLATGSRDSTARLWQAATGKPHGPLLRHKDYIMALAFSPDGKLLATASWDYAARLWDTTTGKPVGPEMRHVAPVRAVAFSPDGKLVATGSNDLAARLWETASGRQRGKSMNHAYDVTALTFSRDGKLLVTGSADAGVRLWDTSTGEPHGAVMWHEAAVVSVAFSPDGERLATGSQDGTARIWEARTGKPHGQHLRHQSALVAVAFTPDGGFLATGSLDGTARLWSMPSLPEEGPLPNRRLPHPSIVWGVAFSPDGKWAATACLDGAGRLWETATGRPHGPLLRHSNAVKRVAFSPDGKWIATTSFDHTVRVWDAATGKQRGPALRHQNWVKDAAFSRDGKLLATASDDRTVRLWDAASGRQRGPALSHPDGVARLAMTPDGKRLATGTVGSVRLWELTTGKPLGTLLRCPGTVLVLAFSPDGKLLATGLSDGTARLWNAVTGEPLGPPLRHQKMVQDVAFSPDGKLLATTAREEGARIWETTTGKACGPPLDPAVIVEAVSFSPDGTLLLTSSRQNHPRLWRLPPPASGEREMELRTWVALGARLNARGDVEALPWHEWRRLRGEQATRERRQAQRASERIGDPTAPPWVAWSNWGDAFIARSRGLQAVAAFTQAIQRGADDWWVWYRRGQAYAFLQDWEKAKADCTDAIQRGASLQHVWRDQALLRLVTGDVEGYRTTCARMIDRFVWERDFVTLGMLGITCDAGVLPAADLARVIGLAETWVAREPQHSGWLHILGSLLYRTGRYEAALRRLNESLAAPNSGGRADFWIILAMCHHRLGHVTEARQLLDKASQMINNGGPLSYMLDLKCRPMLREAEALIHGARQGDER